MFSIRSPGAYLPFDQTTSVLGNLKFQQIQAHGQFPNKQSKKARVKEGVWEAIPDN